MGSGKGGGSVDAGPMLQYGNKALDLQKQIYEEGKAANLPYQTAGVSGLNELMMRLGLGTGSATGTRTAEQIRKDLMPSYTTNQSATPAGVPAGTKPLIDYMQIQNTAGLPGGGKYTYTQGPHNQIFASDAKTGMVYTMNPTGLGGSGDSPGYRSQWTAYGGSSGGGPVTDNAALDAAVQKALADQEAATAAAQQNPLYGSLLKSFGMEDYQADPGYQFRLSEGNKALDRSLAASGRYLTPERQKALIEYNQNMGSQEYGNAYNRYTQDQGNIYNRLAGIAGVGQTAVAQNQQAGQQYGQSASDLYTGMGNSIVAANQANQANKGSMFNTLLGGGLSLAGSTYGGGGWTFSDRRLKIDIEPVGEENGFNVYNFRYRDDPEKKLYRGVMADEVKETRPDAIRNVDGYDAVNYDAIGVDFREIM